MRTTLQGNARVASLLYALTGLFWFSQYAITPYINAELERMGQTAAFMGLVGGAYGLSQTLLRLPMGLLADKLGRHRPFIRLGCLLTALAGVGFLFWYTPASFFVLRLLAGFASASWVSFTVMLGSLYPAHEGPRRITQLNIANQAGRLLSYLIIGAAVARLALRSAFEIGAAAGLLCFGLSLLLPNSPKPAVARAPGSFLAAARDRNMQVTSLLGLLTQIIAFGTYFSFTNNLAMRLGATRPQLSLLSVVLVVPTLAANVLAGGSLAARVKAKHIVTIGFALAALYCIAAPLCQSMAQLYAAQVLAGISSGFTFAVLLGHCVRDIPPASRSAGMGFYQAVYGIGMTLGPILMGLLIDAAGLNVSFFAMAALSCVCAGLSMRLMT